MRSLLPEFWLPSRRRASRRSSRLSGRQLTSERLESRQLLAVDLIAQWRADDLNDLLADKELVPTWTDSVGGTTATAAGSPRLVKEAIGERSTVRFSRADGVDTLGIPAAESPWSGIEDFSMAVVFATPSETLNGGNQLWFLNTGLVDGTDFFGTTADWGLVLSGAGHVGAGLGGPAQTVYSDTGGLNDGEFHVAVFTRQEGNLNLYVDGQLAGTRSDGSVVPRIPVDVTFGAVSGNTFAYNGDIAEIRLYSSELTASEASEVWVELQDYYLHIPPTAAAESYTVAEDATLTVNVADGLLANDTNLEANPLRALLRTSPRHGELQLAEDGSFVYEPDGDYHGLDSFTYVANNFLDSNAATVTLEVTPVDDPATAVADRYLVDAGVPLDVAAANGVLSNDLNPDALAITALLVEDVSQGALELDSDGSFRYDPGGFVGTATFRYLVQDTGGDRNAVTVTLDIDNVPAALDDSFTVAEDVLLEVDAAGGLLLNDTDGDDDPLTAQLVKPPRHGELTLQADGSFTYQPAAHYHGLDSFLYRVDDGDQLSAPATVEIRVQAVNDPPAAIGDSYFLLPDTRLLVSPRDGVKANDFDVEGTDFIARLATGPRHGELVFRADGSFQYLPQPGYVGIDQFTYQVIDSQLDGTTATVQLYVHADPLVISEFLANNTDSLFTQFKRNSDEDWLGRINPDWIELENQTDWPIDLGRVYLSDSLQNPRQWSFPAGTVVPPRGHLVVFASGFDVRDPALDIKGHLHTNFRLAADGEELVLTTPEGRRLFAYQGDLGPQSVDVAYGLVGGVARPIETLTPGTANPTELGPLIADVSHTPARPTEDESLVITAELHDDATQVTLHYYVMFGDEQTLAMRDDGQDADAVAGDGIYTATIPANAYSSGEMLRWYVTAEDSAGLSSRLPYFRSLLDSSRYYGTVVTDPSVVTNLPVLEWFVHRPAGQSLVQHQIYYGGEFYDNVREKTHGQSTGGFRKKSSDLDFTGEHRFLWREGEARVRDINLLSNWADKTKVRNTLAYETRAAAGDGYHFAFPVRVQRNGEFFSVADLVEDGDDDYVERLGLDPAGALYKMYNRLDSANGEKKSRHYEGNADLAELVNSMNLPVDERTNYLFDNLDVAAVINYLAAFVLTSNQDCCHKNYYVYRDSEGTGDWRFLPWDVDLSFGHKWGDGAAYFNDTMAWNIEPFVSASNRVITAIYDTPALREMYVRRVRTLMDELLQPPDTPGEQLKFEQRLDEFVALIDPHDDADPRQGTDDADLDLLNWGSWEHNNGTAISAVSVLSDPDRPETMREAIERVKTDYFPQRRDFLYNTRTVGNGGEIPGPQLGIPQIVIGNVEFAPASGDWREEFVRLDNPTTDAVDVSGWKLQGSVQHVLQPGSVIPAGGSMYLSPDVVAFRGRVRGPSGGQDLFVQGAYSGQLPDGGGSLQLVTSSAELVDDTTYAGTLPTLSTALRVSEIQYHPTDPTAAEELAGVSSGDEFEFIELVNTSQEMIDLSSGRLGRVTVGAGEQGVEFNFATGKITRLAPGERVLVVENEAAFALRYGQGLPVAGEWTGQLSNNREQITLLEGDTVIQQFTYDDAWHSSTDGRGFTLEFTADLEGSRDAWRHSASWAPSGQFGGTPGTTSVLGDFDGDGRATAVDIDLLVAASHTTEHPLGFDLDGDRRVTRDDVDVLVFDVLGTEYGDFNLNGQIELGMAGEPGDGQTLLGQLGIRQLAGWANGDMDGDGYVMASQDGALFLASLAADSATAAGSVERVSATDRPTGAGPIAEGPLEPLASVVVPETQALSTRLTEETAAAELIFSEWEGTVPSTSSHSIPASQLFQGKRDDEQGTQVPTADETADFVFAAFPV